MDIYTVTGILTIVCFWLLIVIGVMYVKLRDSKGSLLKVADLPTDGIYRALEDNDVVLIVRQGTSEVRAIHSRAVRNAIKPGESFFLHMEPGVHSTVVPSSNSLPQRDRGTSPHRTPSLTHSSPNGRCGIAFFLLEKEL